jgi:colicin import membrane protein
MARPGVVLRRAVGTDANFSEHAEFPKDLPGAEINGTHGKRAPKSPAASPPRKLDDNVAREAAMAYAREQNRRDRERRRHEAAQEAERNRRSQEVAKAEAALEKAKRTHDTKTEEIAAARPRSTGGRKPRKPDGISSGRNYRRHWTGRGNSGASRTAT